MQPKDRAQPAARDKPGWGGRMLRRLGRAPLYVKLLAVVAAVFLSPIVILFAMASGGAAVAQKRPGRGAAFAVASWGFAVALL
jgi:hypothetical protein